jgi:helix-turn-helix protein
MNIQSYQREVSNIKDGQYCCVNPEGSIFLIKHDRTKLGAITSTLLFNKERGWFRVSPDKLVYWVLTL